MSTGRGMGTRNASDRSAHFEEDLLVFLVGLRLDLLRELDHGLEMRVVLLIL